MANISASFINQLSQFGTTYFDLIIKDEEGIIPDKRTTIKFKHPEELVTEETLQQAAQNQIDLYIQEWNEANS